MIRESDRKNMSKDPTFVQPPVPCRWQDSTSWWSVWDSGVRVTPLTREIVFLVKTDGQFDNNYLAELFVCPCPRKFMSSSEFVWETFPGPCWSRPIQVLLDSLAGSPWRGVILKNRHIYHVMNVGEVLLQGILLFLGSTLKKLRFC